MTFGRKAWPEKSKDLLLEKIEDSNEIDEDISKLHDYLTQNENFFKLIKEKPLITSNLTKDYEQFHAVKVNLTYTDSLFYRTNWSPFLVR